MIEIERRLEKKNDEGGDVKEDKDETEEEEISVTLRESSKPWLQ